MKEILFRAKWIEKRKWVYGYYVCLKELKPFIPSGGKTTREEPENCHLIVLEGRAHIEYLEVDPETVSQFTGCRDAYNRRIFEGDAVRSIYEDKFAIVQGIDKNTADTMRHYEVIGNVWDDPYLREGYPVPARYKEGRI